MEAKEYFELQEKIHEKLLEENKNTGLNFSVRKKFYKEAISNYFLGTFKSQYIGFSLWYIRLDYPGASIDLLTYVIKQQRGKWRIYLQGHQTKAPNDKQNKINLDFIQKLKTPFLELEKKGKYNYWENKKEAKMHECRIGLYNESKEAILSDLIELINATKPIVDKLMKEFKKTNVNWDARTINDEEFEKWQNKLKTKRIPYDENKIKSGIPDEHKLLIERLQLLGYEESTNMYKILDRIGNELNLVPNDKRICYSLDNKSSIGLTIGEKYCAAAEVKKKNSKFYYIHNTNNKEWLKETSSFSEMYNHIESILISCKKQLDITAKSRNLRHNSEALEKTMFDENYRKEIFKTAFNGNNMKKNQNLNSSLSIPINTILYGPPGTGKTYKLKTKYFPNYTTQSHKISRDERLQETLKDLTWWQVIAIVLLDIKKAKAIDIYNHEYVKLKENLTTSKTVSSTISGKLQAHTVDNCTDVRTSRKLQPKIFFKEPGAIWRIDKEGYEEIENEINNISHNLKNIENQQNLEIKRYEFVTFHQSYSYEDFIEGIKPVLEDETDGDLHYEIKDGVFKKLCQRAKNDSENNYAIFIDEINRGNVSSIFGELITLIEPDKRIGMKNSMNASLPYSRESFGVPNNLHIYGTMNTADRSVEALDTALRRRFSFVEMMPDASLITAEIDGVSLSKVLTTINERIEVLVDRDHTIGHSYLMDVDSTESLRLAFKDKIIPLLQEYFYGDYGKIGLVLGDGFVKKKDKNDNLFSNFNYDGDSDDLNQGGYELIPIDDDFKIIKGLKLLLNIKEEEQKA